MILSRFFIFTVSLVLLFLLQKSLIAACLSKFITWIDSRPLACWKMKTSKVKKLCHNADDCLDTIYHILNAWQLTKIISLKSCSNGRKGLSSKVKNPEYDVLAAMLVFSYLIQKFLFVWGRLYGHRERFLFFPAPNNKKNSTNLTHSATGRVPYCKMKVEKVVKFNHEQCLHFLFRVKTVGGNFKSGSIHVLRPLCGWYLTNRLHFAVFCSRIRELNQRNEDET